MPDESESETIWLVIGLGNPGPDYSSTYHNVGFRVVEILARRRGTSLTSRSGQSVRLARLRGARSVLVQPLTYMNRVGVILGSLFDEFGGDSQLLVVSDDLDLPIGKIRIRERGSAGGHNGLRSLGSAYGSDDYLRVRVGIMPERGIGDGREFVLSEVAAADCDLLERTEALAADAVEHIIEVGARSAMSKYNGLLVEREEARDANRD